MRSTRNQEEKKKKGIDSLIRRRDGGLWCDLQDLDDDKKEKGICVRAVRVYDLPTRDGRPSTIEVIFHDSKGTRIHARIRRPEMKKFRPKIKEGAVCALKNFVVMRNNQDYKTTNHPFTLTFYEYTHWKDLSAYRFPKFMFNFCPFEKLLEPLSQNLLTDVIGKVIARTGIQSRFVQGVPQRFIELTLEDTRGQQLRCTLWGDYIEKFNESVGAGITNPILIVQFGRPKEYMKEVSISTSFHVTKLILDNDCEEAKEFLKAFKNGDEDSRSSSTFTLTQSSEVTEDSNANLRITTIKNLLTETADGYYWIMADIVSVENYKDWYYLACNNKTCSRKVYVDGDCFRCEQCEKTMTHVEYRYKVTLTLMDESGHATFILWDQECKEIMGIPASKLRDIMIERNGDDNDFPVELEQAVLSKSGLFKTILRNATYYTRIKGPRTFGVLNMVTDPKTVAMYKPVVKERKEMDGWSSYEFEFLNKEVICSGEKGKDKKDKGKQKITEVYEEDEMHHSLKDAGSSTKAKKAKLCIG
ncbi:unnamed protein product [Cuscuta campestris]|uniref:Replication factor A C-terminal domain-containing protein n=1 Tax=Cuscuta campestris TaxID=132261 RepID=A0A484LF15_9ASTE|nr:unnamed protein product [Cuscuta campestris]